MSGKPLHSSPFRLNVAQVLFDTPGGGSMSLIKAAEGQVRSVGVGAAPPGAMAAATRSVHKMAPMGSPLARAPSLALPLFAHSAPVHHCRCRRPAYCRPGP